MTAALPYSNGMLHVGHIDEFMAIIPASDGGDSWQVVLASPQGAWDRMGWVEEYEPFFYGDATDPVQPGQATGGTATTLQDSNPLFLFTDGPPWRYVRIYDGTGAGQVAEIDTNGISDYEITVASVWRLEGAEEWRNAIVDGEGRVPQTTWFEVPDAMSKYILVPSSREWRWGSDDFPAVITTREVALDPEFWAIANGPAEQNINAAKTTLQAALAGAPVTFIEVPAVFLGDASTGSGDAFAFMPGLANLQVWNGQLWLPDPSGPRMFGGEDTMQVGADAVLELGTRTTYYIDNWDTYHRAFGEVHCGTNVLRAPAQDCSQWWQAPPS